MRRGLALLAAPCATNVGAGKTVLAPKAASVVRNCRLEDPYVRDCRLCLCWPLVATMASLSSWYDILVLHKTSSVSLLLRAYNYSFARSAIFTDLPPRSMLLYA